MADVVGTVTGCTLVQGSRMGPEQSSATTVRKTYLLNLSTAIYTASADSVVVTGVPDRIKEFTRKGTTVTYRAAMAGPPGKTAAGAAAYVSVGSVITNSSGTLTFQIGGTTTEANTAAATGVGLYVLVDEGITA